MKDLSAGIVLNMDEEAMNNAVTAYNNRIERQTLRVKHLRDALDEAHKSAPTCKAEEARAEAYGARALGEFKGNPLHTVPGDDESRHTYPVDLANQEGTSRTRSWSSGCGTRRGSTPTVSPGPSRYPHSMI